MTSHQMPARLDQLADETLLKLLELVARDVSDGVDPSDHLSTYEALARAESLRRSR